MVTPVPDGSLFKEVLITKGLWLFGKKGKFTNGKKFMIMATKPKNKRSDHAKKKGKSVVSRKVRDYGNEPFFIKKADESQAFLEKHGFPEELLRKR
jgi:hypothetical protein